MRVTASREELEYLTSIGIGSTHTALSRNRVPSAKRRPKHPVPAASSPSAVPAATPPTLSPETGSAPTRHSSQSSAGQGWAIAVVIIVTLLAIACCARGQAPASLPEVGPPAPLTVSEPQPDGSGLSQKIETISGALLDLQKHLEALPTISDIVALAGHCEAVRADLALLKEAESAAHAEDSRHFTGEIARSEKRIKVLVSALHTGIAEQGRRLEALARRLELCIQAERNTQAASMQQALMEQAADAHRADLFLSGSVVAVALGLLLAGTRFDRTRSPPLPFFADRTQSVSHASAKFTRSRLAKLTPPPAGTATNIAPFHALDETLPSPATYTRNMVAAAAVRKNILFKPKAPSGRWGLALATAQGHVRPNNQDYGLAFSIRGRDVLIVTDGCGGTPGGQRAAFSAATSAADSLIRAFGAAKPFCAPAAGEAALKAIRDAASALATEAERLNLSGTSSGLRTTAIVTIADRKRRQIGYAYIGDGGAMLVHPTGEVQSFLEPQRVGAALAASLGPQTVGEPVSGVLPWPQGALILVGTDGVFDRVESTFPSDVLRACISANGDLQRTAEQAVTELASFQDRDGYVADDNLTLGIIADGTETKVDLGLTRAVEPASTTAPTRSLTIQA